MKCMCAQTRPRFILSSEGVFGGMEFEPMLTPREKSPLPENVPRGGSNPRHCGQRAQALPTELFRPPENMFKIFISAIPNRTLLTRDNTTLSGPCLQIEHFKVYSTSEPPSMSATVSCTFRYLNVLLPNSSCAET